MGNVADTADGIRILVKLGHFLRKYNEVSRVNSAGCFADGRKASIHTFTVQTLPGCSMGERLTNQTDMIGICSQTTDQMFKVKPWGFHAQRNRGTKTPHFQP